MYLKTKWNVWNLSRSLYKAESRQRNEDSEKDLYSEWNHAVHSTLSKVHNLSTSAVKYQREQWKLNL